MKKILFCLITAVIFYGCVTTQSGSDGSMSTGEMCVNECNDYYNQCKMGCTEGLDGYLDAGYQEQCKFQCKTYLNECNEVCNKTN